MIVSRAEHEARIAEVRAGVARPELGIYGPSSTAWRIARESVVFLGAGRAALLQLAHPYVAHAIAQHSATMRDPIGRFNRTFQALYGMIFGDLDTAIAAARRVRAVHDRIHGPIDEDVGRFPRGHRYHANDASALLWVHATLVETSLLAFEMGLGPLSIDDKSAYYGEVKRMGALFGISSDVMPATWSDFDAYCARTVASDDIAVGQPAREIASFLFSPSSVAMRPAMRWYRVLTTGMLPPKVREGYGFPFGRAEQALYAASVAAIRRAWPLIPERLRRRPEYTEALRRMRGSERADWIGRAVERVLLHAVRPKHA